MKIVSNEYKETIRTSGREIDVIITYDNTTLTASQINTIIPSFNGDILKSVMKSIEIDSNILIPEGTFFNVKFGIKVDNEYEYIDYGNYIVKTARYDVDTLSYKMTCYDKLMTTMIDINDDFIKNISYPITLKNYLELICTQLGLSLATPTFVNSEVAINRDIHSGVGYTYRDILDEIAQVTGSILCVNDNDEIEIRYPSATNQIIDEHWLNEINVTVGEKYGPINAIVFSRSEDSDTINQRDEESINTNGITELKILDNQILSTNDRSDFMPQLFEYLNGFEYYICDYDSAGITFLELGDQYTISINGVSYSTVMLNDNVNIEQGLTENIFVTKPIITVTDYKKSSSTDKLMKKAFLSVDKQNQKIDAVVEIQEEQSKTLVQLTLDTESIQSTVLETKNDLNTVQEAITTINQTMLTQTSEAFEMLFNQTGIAETIDTIQNELNSNTADLNNLTEYIRFEGAEITLGRSDSQTKLIIKNDRISFMTGETESAYISENTLYITDSTILNKMQVGHWETKEDQYGNLNTKWIEGVT